MSMLMVLLRPDAMLRPSLQEQKRQRLRDAGRRKLEEFKRRNVESLPAVPQLGTRSFSGAGLAPLTGPPMASLARNTAGHMNMADLSRAIPADNNARGPPRSGAAGPSDAGRLLLRPAAPIDGPPNAAAGAELANGNQNESAPVSRASSTNSAMLQGDRLGCLRALERHASCEPWWSSLASALLSCQRIWSFQLRASKHLKLSRCRVARHPSHASADPNAA